MDKLLVTTSSFGKEDQGPVRQLREAGYEVVFNPYGRKLTENEVLELLKEVKPVGMIAGVEPLTAQVISSAAGRIKVISRCGIGLDTVDTDAANKEGIIVLNTPDGPTQAVSELTVCLMLAVLRRVIETDAGIRSGNWRRPMGNLLGEQTVGLVGCGRIGSVVAKLLVAFGANVLGYDPNLKEHSKISLVSWDELLSQADIVSLHIPYSESAYHLIDNKVISEMKPGAVLINTSRGGIVGEDALYEAISSGYLSGAGIDTFEKEPYTGPLSELGQVVLTPHIGSYAKEARIKMEEEAVKNLLSALAKL